MANTIETLDDAIQAFAEAADAPPNPALLWALDHWDAAVPKFLDMLAAYTDGTDGSDVTTDALFFIIHLFGGRAETRAFPDLCRLMLDEDRLNSALGDTACVETLKCVLISCFDGDASPLRTVIESTEAEEITRGEALLALAWLARTGAVPEPAFRAYIGRLYEAMLPREPDYVWYNLVVTAAIMGYSEYAALSAKLIDDGLVPEEWLTKAELPELLSSGDPKGLEGLKSEEVGPFRNAIESLQTWPWDNPEDEEEEAQAPMINPLRHIGRNDPCPCGSGKKFKNCHLVVE